MISRRSINYSEILDLNRFTVNTLLLFPEYMQKSGLHSFIDTPHYPQSSLKKKGFELDEESRTVTKAGQTYLPGRIVQKYFSLTNYFLILCVTRCRQKINFITKQRFQSQSSNYPTSELNFPRYFYDWSTSVSMGWFDHFCLEKGKGIVPNRENVSTRKHKSMRSMPYAKTPQSSMLTY